MAVKTYVLLFEMMNLETRYLIAATQRSRATRKEGIPLSGPQSPGAQMYTSPGAQMYTSPGAQMYTII